MSVTLKLDKGMVERLMEWTDIGPEDSKNLSGKELTLELNERDVLIELHKKDGTMEISDLNGSFGVWFKVTKDKVEKLKNIIEFMGP
ncbi:MAG: hypothetical protein JW700_01530 [Candidatus Aenigmarchaeota archaeon]|nr:hypothetical protein [Candidatus Aenigmarchaeota archaeon]